MLPSPAALSVLMAGLSGHVWQRVTAGVLLLPDQPWQLHPVSVHTMHWLQYLLNFSPEGEIMVFMKQEGTAHVKFAPQLPSHYMSYG